MNFETIYAQIGTLIRDRRKQVKLTQKALAARLEISRASLANVETGRQRLLVHQLYRIAEALGLEIMDLLPPPISERQLVVRIPLPQGLKLEQQTQLARLFSEAPSNLSAERNSRKNAAKK